MPEEVRISAKTFHTGHNHFEADTSLTRNDYFLAPEPGNNFKFNSTVSLKDLIRIND